MTSIISDCSEAVELCPQYHLFLKPITRLTVSVSLPHLKTPGKSISNWEVMERLKAMVQPEQFSSLRISKSTMDFIRFEGEVENRGVIKQVLTRLEGKSIKLSGFTDVLKVRSAENKVDFPTRHDWDSFFRDAKDMNETVPGERPDTVRLEGLPCKWFAQKEACPDRPSEAVLREVFQCFGRIRNVDVPMLDPYREEMTGTSFNTFSFGGHLNFEAYVQYDDHTGFLKAMEALRGMKLMFRGDDGKCVACSIKVTFDTSKHLSEASLKKRQQERVKLQELERLREENKRRQKEDEERQREEERRQRELEEEEKERKKEEKLRKREQKLKEREEKKLQKKLRKQQEEQQKQLQQKIVLEERKLLLAQRNLEAIRLIAELLSRAKVLKQRQMEQQRTELLRLEARRKQQEEELRRVEAEKTRALELQLRERELRDRLLGNLLKKSTGTGEPLEPQRPEKPKPAQLRTRRRSRSQTRRRSRNRTPRRSPSHTRRRSNSRRRSCSRTRRRSRSHTRRRSNSRRQSHSRTRRWSRSHTRRSNSRRRSHSRTRRRSRSHTRRRSRRKCSHGESSSRSRSSSRGRRRY